MLTPTISPTAASPTTVVVAEGVEVRVGRAIVVRVGLDKVEFGSIGAAVEFADTLIGEAQSARALYRDRRLKLGHFVRMVKGQLDHGEYLEFLASLGKRHALAVGSLRKLALLASRVCDHKGALSPAKVRVCVNENASKWCRGTTLGEKAARIVEGKAMPRLTMRELEQLGGTRSDRAGDEKAEPRATVIRHSGRQARVPDVVGQIGMQSLYERARSGLERAVRVMNDEHADLEVKGRLRALLEELAAYGA